MDKYNYFTSNGCKQNTAHPGQEEVTMHRKIFHVGENSSKHQGGKTAQTLSELLKTRQQLQENIFERHQDLVELEGMTDRQEHSIRLLKDHIKQLEEAYKTVDLEIEKLKRIQKSLVKIDVGSGPSSSRNSIKKSLTPEKEVTNSREDIKLLIQVNSMKQTKNKRGTKAVDDDTNSISRKSSNLSDTDSAPEVSKHQKENLSILNEQIHHLQNQVKSLKAKHESDRARLKREVAVKEDLRKMYDSKQGELSEKYEEIEEQQEKINLLENQLFKQSQALENLTRDLATHQQKYKDTKQKLLDSEIRCQHISDDVSKLIGDKQVLEIENQELESALENTKSLLEKKDDVIGSLRQSGDTMKTTVRRLSTITDEYKRKEHKTQEIVEEKERNIQLLREAGTALEMEFNRMVSDLEEYQTKEQIARGLIREKEHDIKLLQKSVTSLEAKVKRLNMEIEESRLLEDRNEKFRFDLEQNVTELEADIEAKKSSVKELMQNLNTARKNQEDSQRMIKELRKEMEILTRERNNLRKEVEKTKRKNDNIKKEFHRLKEKYIGLEKEFKNVSNGKLNVEGELEELKDCLEKMVRQQEEKSEVEKTENLTKLASRRIKIKGIRKDLNKAAKCQQIVDEGLKFEIERLNQVIKDRDSELMKMEVDSKQIQKELLEVIDELNLKCAQKEDTVDHSGFKTEADSNPIDDTVSKGSEHSKDTKADDSKESSEGFAQLRMDLKQARSLVDEKEKELNEANLKAKKESYVLTNANCTLQQEKTALERKVLEIKEEKKHTSNKLKDMHNYCEKIKLELDTQLAETTDSYEKKIVNLKEDFNKLLKRNQESEKVLESQLQNQTNGDHNNSEDRIQLEALKSNLAKLRDDLRSRDGFQQTEAQSCGKYATIEINELRDSMQKQKQDFEKKIKDYQDIEAALESKIKELTNSLGEMEYLRLELSNVKSQRDGLQKDLARNDQELRKQENISAGEMAKEVQNLREKLVDCVKEKQELQNKLEDSLLSQSLLEEKFGGCQFGTSSEEFENVKKELNALKAEKQQLNNELKRALAQLEKLGNSGDSEQVKRLRHELQSLQTEKDQVKVELDESLDKQRSMVTKLEESGKDLEQLERLREDLQDAERDKHQLKIELEESLAQQRTMQSKLDELGESDNENSSSEGIEELEKQLLKVKDENQSLQKELQESHQKVEDLEDQLKKQKSTAHADVIESLKAEKDELDKKIEESRKYASFIVKNRESDYREIERLKKQLDLNKKKLTKANKTVEAKTEELAKIDESKEISGGSNEVQKELDTAQEQIKLLNGSLEEKEKLLVELAEKTSAADGDQKNLHKELVEAKDEVKSLTTKLEEKDQKIIELSEKSQTVSPSNPDSEILRRDLKMAKEQVSMLTSSLQEKDKLMIQAKQAGQDEMRRDLKMAKEQVSMLTTSLQEKDKLLTEAKQKIPAEDIEKKLTSVNKQVKILTDCVRSKEKELSEQASHLLRRERELQQDNRDTQDELSETKDVLRHLKAEHEILKEKQRTSIKQGESIAKLEQDKNQMESDLKKYKNMLETTNNTLNKTKLQLEEVKQASEEHTKEKQALKSGHASEIANLRKEITESKSNYAQLKKQYEKDMADKSQDDEAEKKVQHLVLENENLEDDNYQLRLKIDGLEKDMVKIQENSAPCDCKKNFELKSITSDESLDLRTTTAREKEHSHQQKNNEVNWNTACRSFTKIQTKNAESKQNCSSKNSAMSTNSANSTTNILGNKTMPSQQQPRKPRLKELCGYKLYNDPDPNYPESEEEPSIGIDMDPIEEVGRECKVNKIRRVPSYELAAQAYEDYQYQLEMTKRGGGRCPSPVMVQQSDDEDVVPFQIQSSSPYHDDDIMNVCQPYKSAYTFDPPSKQIATKIKTKKNKKSKKVKSSEKLQQSLAPLNGPLPPTQASCLGKSTVPLIEGSLAPPQLAPIAPLLNPNRNRNPDISSSHQQQQKQPKKKKNFNLSETGNPLDAKPLPGLKNIPPTLAPVPKIT
uniref:Uncharacterized protein n=1 Tax=Clytia hemisphaerica TaxID=252671 RepID=A0A7M5XI91_9CNID